LAGLNLETLAADCSELFDIFKRHFGESSGHPVGESRIGRDPARAPVIEEDGELSFAQ
jgi:hypothetical protein